jgi:hypothetical protein
MAAKPPKDPKKKRLAQQLRANLARRKAQARAKRAGDTDERPEGRAGAADGKAVSAGKDEAE